MARNKSQGNSRGKQGRRQDDLGTQQNEPNITRQNRGSRQNVGGQGKVQGQSYDQSRQDSGGRRDNKGSQGMD